jgi:hypothetical protein
MQQPKFNVEATVYFKSGGGPYIIESVNTVSDPIKYKLSSDGNMYNDGAEVDEDKLEKR